STQNDHPRNASKPFDKERDGLLWEKVQEF
ncbi:unnamed protein product, partial [marine sediment metagenome]